MEIRKVEQVTSATTIEVFKHQLSDDECDWHVEEKKTSTMNDLQTKNPIKLTKKNLKKKPDS